ncbi:hypothetical protein [Curvivirga aplysinae]|uniref:hypothetical protein n=1 Tax=Curvivirga aplysinae TaxID=2529852 RepID=UPI0012BC261F|nr:hypothetical protein [Curvivirga aplysinae]MTI10192.1 hypothetical protein [Curvivirga aplysinae]
MRFPPSTDSYQTRSRAIATQRLVNIYPEIQPPNAYAKMAFIGTPGLKLFKTVGDGPIRGLHMWDDVLFAVSGEELYSISADMTVIKIGDIPGTGTVDIIQNLAETMIRSGEKGYVIEGGIVTEITDEDFVKARSLAYLDGYAIYTREQGRWAISKLQKFKEYDGLDYATAESHPDDLVGVIVSNREVWLMGEKTIEVWWNTGDSNFPFERFPDGVIEKGCLAGQSVAKADGSVFWLGSDFMVYQATGRQPVRISTHAIEEVFESYKNPEQAVAFTYSQNGHLFYVLTFAEATWCYDLATQLWHERLSYGLPNWRVSTVASDATGAVRAFREVVMGDAYNGNIYILDQDEYTENGTEIPRIITSPIIHAENANVSQSELILEMESGVGTGNGQGEDPQAMLRWSDNNGATWSNEVWASMGKQGEYGWVCKWTRLGMFKKRVYEVTITDPVRVVILAMDTKESVSER